MQRPVTPPRLRRGRAGPWITLHSESACLRRDRTLRVELEPASHSPDAAEGRGPAVAGTAISPRISARTGLRIANQRPVTVALLSGQLARGSAPEVLLPLTLGQAGRSRTCLDAAYYYAAILRNVLL